MTTKAEAPLFPCGCSVNKRCNEHEQRWQKTAQSPSKTDTCKQCGGYGFVRNPVTEFPQPCSLCTKTDTSAVPAWALKCERDIRWRYRYAFTYGKRLDGKQVAAIVARHAAQAWLDDQEEATRELSEELRKLAAANAELLEALSRIAAETSDSLIVVERYIHDIASATLAKHTPKEGV